MGAQKNVVKDMFVAALVAFGIVAVSVGIPLIIMGLPQSEKVSCKQFGAERATTTVFNKKSQIITIQCGKNRQTFNYGVRGK